MEFDIKQFERAAKLLDGFCRRMEKSNLPPLNKDYRDDLLTANLHMQKALVHLKSKRSDG